MRTPKHITAQWREAGHHRARIGAPQPLHLSACERVVFARNSISIQGWPSRGGLIVLTDATLLDFDTLNLDPLNPQLLRAKDQESEDGHCQLLLRLGAKWFDSQLRYRTLCDLFNGRDRFTIKSFESGEQSLPTAMERTWVSVAIDDDNGGFWVAEYEDVLPGEILPLDEERLLTPEASRVKLARSMREKSEILKSLPGGGAKFYATLSDYNGVACFNAWATKTSGEFGPLVKYEDHLYPGRYK